MTKEISDRLGRRVVLEDITGENWRAVADVAPADDQRRFVAALGARYLLLSIRGVAGSGIPSLCGRATRSWGTSCGHTTTREAPTGSAA